jgi:chromosome segregation ATPase
VKECKVKVGHKSGSSTQKVTKNKNKKQKHKILFYLKNRFMTMPTTSATNTSIRLDNATLRERILTSGAGNARGSLTKVVSQYREFIHQLMCTRCGDGADQEGDDNNNSAAAAAATNLKTELLLHDLEIRKLILSSQAYNGNSSTYTSTLSQMQNSLSSIQQEIETLTLTLVQQRQIHSRRREYNALAKIANEQHPPIYKTKSELEQVNEQIQSVEREVGEAKEKLKVREKQLRLLMSCLGDLKTSLNEEEIVEKNAAEMENVEGYDCKNEEAAVPPPEKKRKRDDTI